jgi:hypothetical protein
MKLWGIFNMKNLKILILVLLVISAILAAIFIPGVLHVLTVIGIILVAIYLSGVIAVILLVISRGEKNVAKRFYFMSWLGFLFATYFRQM